MSVVGPSIDEIRAQFPALASGFVYLENAGGSQVPGCVIDGVSEFLRESYVQTGVEYPASQRASETVVQAHDYLNLFFNGTGLGHVAIGASTTQLLYMLGNCYGLVLQEGDEIIVSVTNHESNVGPWVRLARLGVKIVWWGVDARTGLGDLDELRELVNERTKIVAFTQTCNLSGDRVDTAVVSRIAHNVGARVVADCVAAAPHEAMDVAASGVDFCVFSAYKVYGPHFAALWGKSECWAEFEGPNHFFLPNENAYRFEIGCLPCELLSGFLRGQEYFRFLAEESVEFSRATLERAYRVIGELEKGLTAKLSAYLLSKEKVRLLGPQGAENRHPTFGFVHETVPSDEITTKVLEAGIGIRYGHMYAYRMCEAIQVATDSGVVRVSALHYNTEAEIDKLCDVLDEIL